MTAIALLLSLQAVRGGRHRRRDRDRHHRVGDRPGGDASRPRLGGIESTGLPQHPPARIVIGSAVLALASPTRSGTCSTTCSAAGLLGQIISLGDRPRTGRHRLRGGLPAAAGARTRPDDELWCGGAHELRPLPDRLPRAAWPGSCFAGYIAVDPAVRGCCPAGRGPVAWTATGGARSWPRRSVRCADPRHLRAAYRAGAALLLLGRGRRRRCWRWQDRLPAGRRHGSELVQRRPPRQDADLGRHSRSPRSPSAPSSSGVTIKLGTGMTGFDSTWYHGPFAAGIAQSGDTFSLHLPRAAVPQLVLPAELGADPLARDAGLRQRPAFASASTSAGSSPACWPPGASAGPTAAHRSRWPGSRSCSASTAMADQAGEARNDIVGTFFLLGGLAVMINAAAGGPADHPRADPDRRARRPDSRPAPRSTSFRRRSCFWPARSCSPEPSRRLRNGLAGRAAPCCSAAATGTCGT